MPVGTVTNTYAGVAHGAINWDTQLRDTVAGLTNAVNQLVGTSVGFAYNGTVKDYNASGGWFTQFKHCGNSVVLNLNVDPGANGFGAGSIIGQIATGTAPILFRPAGNVQISAPMYNNSGNFVGTGTVTVLAASGNVVIGQFPSGVSSIGSGGFILCCTSWPAQ